MNKSFIKYIFLYYSGEEGKGETTGRGMEQSNATKRTRCCNDGTPTRTNTKRTSPSTSIREYSLGF